MVKFTFVTPRTPGLRKVPPILRSGNNSEDLQQRLGLRYEEATPSSALEEDALLFSVTI